jgi:hypothetical protein
MRWHIDSKTMPVKKRMFLLKRSPAIERHLAATLRVKLIAAEMR